MVGANLILLACLSFAAGQVFETQEIKHGDCTGVCGTLKLTTESGDEVEFHETNKKVKVKNVVKARVFGDGCFLIHKSTNFRSSQFLVEGKVNEYLLKDHISWTTVKSIKYSANCQFPRTAGVEGYVIGGVVAMVLLVAVAVFAWSRIRRRRQAGPGQEAV